MNKLHLIAAAVLAMTACTDQKTFTIEGTVEGAQDSTVYFYNKSLSGAVLTDSARLGADGTFRFRAPAPEAPDFYLLRVGAQWITLSVDSTETVTVRAKMPDMASNYTVEGSDNCEKIRQLSLKQQELQRQAIALERERSLSPEQKGDSLQRLVDAFKDDVRRNYIFREPQKAYAYFALFQTLGQWNIFERSNPDDVRVFGAVATCWDTYWPGALRTEHLHNTALKGMNEQRAVSARQQATLDSSKIVDSGLIELSLPDANGQTRTLGQLKGQVVLLDFHAFGMKESAARILQLRELYNKFHQQGLEIYQVAIDPDEHFWKQQTAQLPWVSVYDPEGSSLQLYNVQAVPEFFLIDRSNTLQKRSSQMDDVEQEIRRLLANPTR